MKTYHYTTEEAPAAIVVTLAKNGKVTDTIALNASTANEDGSFTVTQTLSSKPVAATYSAITEAIIALKYTTGEEIALNRKEEDNTERLAYLEFVAAAKAAAKAALGITEENEAADA